jgi:hypothetical protein
MCKGTTLSSTAAYSKKTKNKKQKTKKNKKQKTKNKKKHTDSENFLNTHAEMEHLTVL